MCNRELSSQPPPLEKVASIKLTDEVVPSKLDNATLAISMVLALQRLDIAYTELASVDDRPES